MSEGKHKVRKDVIVIGAGISGVVTAKCLKQSGFDVIVLERTSDVGGLWTFKEKGYGVMRFTHINVSRENYSFSDFPFPEHLPDFVHNTDMVRYVQDYVKHFHVDELIKFNREVISLHKSDDGWEVEVMVVEEDKDGVITRTSQHECYTARFVAIATGHHAKPSWPNFPGQDTFTGKAIHSVDYNDAISNDMVGKRVVVVGIGNSATDVVCNLASMGRCKPVHVSSRSGAWVFPNYLFGRPMDHYACRLFLKLPWRISTVILETVMKIVQGNPKKWNLNPKMHILQTQPSVSPTIIHHIQRKEVKVKPNIKEIRGSSVEFEDGTCVEADNIVFCTGYKINLPFLSDSLREQLFQEDTNTIKLYKNVFSPEIGPSLAFIGFVQPASGGILTMSETQARWWAELCQENVSLPTKLDMEANIKKEEEDVLKRYYKSARHTIQRDPILYNDEIAAFFGAKPEYKAHPWIAWRLLMSSCGASQYRLQGPHKWEGAEREVCKVPVTEFILYGVLAVIVFLLWFFLSFVNWFVDDYLDWDWWWD